MSKYIWYEVFSEAYEIGPVPERWLRSLHRKISKLITYYIYYPKNKINIKMLPKIGSTTQFNTSDFEDDLFTITKDDIIIVKPEASSLTPPQYYQFVGTKAKRAFQQYNTIFFYSMEPEPNLYSLFNIVTKKNFHGH